MRQSTHTPSTLRSRATGSRGVRTIGRALDLLQCFLESEGELTAAQLAQRVGLPRATAHRLAVFLSVRGFLVRDPLTSRFRLGLRLAELGWLALSRNDLRNIARPYLSALQRETNETVFLSTRDGNEVVHLDVLLSTRPGLILTTMPGRRVPVHSAATGKALIAWLPRTELQRILPDGPMPSYTPNTITDRQTLSTQLATIRKQGYSVDNEETMEGLAGIGSPLRDSTGSVVASICVSGPPLRIFAAQEIVANQVQVTAAKISHALGYELMAARTSPG